MGLIADSSAGAALSRGKPQLLMQMMSFRRFGVARCIGFYGFVVSGVLDWDPFINLRPGAS